MPIVRGEHSFDKQFTQIPNAWLRDSRLSLKAIGLLAQLHSHSIGWQVSLASLSKANDCGIDLIRNAIKELETCGYLTREQGRDSSQRFGEAIYRTTEPFDLPLSGFPMTDNPTPKNTNKKNTNDKKYDDWFDDFWAAYPRKVGKETARKSFLKLGETAVLAVAGARRYRDDPNLPPVQFIPHPTTWLNRAGWEDDPLPPRDKTPDEIAAEARAKSERERAISAEFLKQQNALAATAGPPPKCSHDKNPALCPKCFGGGE